MGRLAAGAIVLTLFTAALGGWAGIQYGLRHSHSASGLDDVLHHELGLTTAQEGQITALESEFSAQRQKFEQQMNAANRDLATAIQTDHAYGTPAREAVARFHTAMIGLQEATILHVLAMRKVLTPEQAIKFDETVSKALVSAEP